MKRFLFLFVAAAFFVSCDNNSTSNSEKPDSSGLNNPSTNGAGGMDTMAGRDSLPGTGGGSNMNSGGTTKQSMGDTSKGMQQ